MACGPKTTAGVPRRCAGWLFFEAHYLRDPAGTVWFHRFYMPLRGGPANAASAVRGDADLPKPLGHLETRLAAAPWLMGGALSLVDCCFGPVLDAVDLGGFDLARFPAVADYLARMRALPAWQRGEFWTKDMVKERTEAA